VIESVVFLKQGIAGVVHVTAGTNVPPFSADFSQVVVVGMLT